MSVLSQGLQTMEKDIDEDEWSRFQKRHIANRGAKFQSFLELPCLVQSCGVETNLDSQFPISCNILKFLKSPVIIEQLRKNECDGTFNFEQNIAMSDADSTALLEDLFRLMNDEPVTSVAQFVMDARHARQISERSDVDARVKEWLTGLIDGFGKHIWAHKQFEAIFNAKEKVQNILQFAENERATCELEAAKLDVYAETEKMNNAENQRAIDYLRQQLAPYDVATDPLFIEMERDPQKLRAILRQCSKDKLTAIEKLLKRMDEASGILSRRPRCNERQAAEYVSRYKSVREAVCMSIRVIVNQTLEKAGSALLTRVTEIEQERMKRHKQRREIEKISRAALKNGKPLSPATTGSDDEDDGEESLAVAEQREELKLCFDPALFHAKFRIHNVVVMPLTSALLQYYANSMHAMYEETLYQLQGVYAAVRLRCLNAAMRRRLESILRAAFNPSKNVGVANSTEGIYSLDSAVRYAVIFWMSTAKLEVATYSSFFPKTACRTDGIETILNALGDTVYNQLRSHIFRSSDLSALCEVVECLVYDIEETASAGERQNMQNTAQETQRLSLRSPTDLDTLTRQIVIRPIFETYKDVVEKIIFFSQIKLRESVSAYPISSVALKAFKEQLADGDALLLFTPIQNSIDIMNSLTPILSSHIPLSLLNDIVLESLDVISRCAKNLEAAAGEPCTTSAAFFALRHESAIRHTIQRRFSALGLVRSNIQFNFDRLRTRLSSFLQFLVVSDKAGQSPPHASSDITTAQSKQTQENHSSPLLLQDAPLVSSRSSITKKITDLVSSVIPELQEVQTNVGEMMDNFVATQCDMAISTTVTKVILPLISFAAGTALPASPQQTNHQEQFETVYLDFWLRMKTEVGKLLLDGRLYLLSLRSDQGLEEWIPDDPQNIKSFDEIALIHNHLMMESPNLSSQQSSTSLPGNIRAHRQRSLVELLQVILDSLRIAIIEALRHVEMLFAPKEEQGGTQQQNLVLPKTWVPVDILRMYFDCAVERVSRISHIDAPSSSEDKATTTTTNPTTAAIQV